LQQKFLGGQKFIYRRINLRKPKKRLSLGKVTVHSFETQVDERNVLGGGITYLTSCCGVTYQSACRTINMATCIPDPEGCNPADTYQAGGTACP
jgi:hypothetical protein